MSDREPLQPRTSYRAFYRITTRWGDNDQYGHVNNVAYYAWFDTAVNAWLIERGLLDPAGEPIGLVVESGCRFARPLSFPEPVEIGLCPLRVGRSSIEWRLGVFGQGEEAAAEGRFVHVYVGRTSRRPVAIPEGWRAALREIER